MNRNKQVIAAMVGALMILQPIVVFAAPGNLSQDPLFVGTDVQPNILFVVDDSTSMDAEVLKSNPDSTRYPEGSSAIVNYCDERCTFDGSGDVVDDAFCRTVVSLAPRVAGDLRIDEFLNSGNLDFAPSTIVSRRYVDSTVPQNTFTCRLFHPNEGIGEMLELCAGYNTMAYDPARTYTPWVGVDDGGTPYTNRTLATALNNPYHNNQIDNLESHVYFVWNDDGDGVYEDGECPVNFSMFDTNDDGEISKSECDVRPAECVSLGDVLTTSEQKQNYANWYSYYRKREYVVKRALSEAIDQSTARMGLATLNHNHSVGMAISDVDNITIPVNATADTNKANLADNLFRIDSDHGTPLRLALERAGNYFEESVTTGVDTLFGFAPAADSQTLTSSPIFTDVNGGSCQKNFAVLLSDGFWNGGDPSVGNTDGSGSGNTRFDGGSYADGFSNTLADVAMNYYERDLAPSLDDDLTASTVDPNDAQHMVTYTVAFGVNGTLSANPADTTTAFAWPQPTADANTTIDDMRHAAWNGRGKFLSAADPQELLDSFSEVLDDIQSRVSSAASVSFNSTSLDNDALLFRAEFNPAGWSGDIQALSVTGAGVGTSQWSAASLLDDNSVTANTRKIITYNGTRGVPFAWPSDRHHPSPRDISVAQVDDLLADAAASGVDLGVAADADAYGSDIVNFLRGDHSEEEGELGATRDFRDRRGNRLGDVVHSAPVFVGTPDASYPDDIAGSSNPYSTFITSNQSRRQLVYVGANDGMLHAFDANTGTEIFAYMPHFLFSSSSQAGLHYLADEDYTHRSYVDLTPATGDVFVDGAWHTYLVGGARSGGNGIFVLDITNPDDLAEAENNANTLVVKEFTDNDLGATYSQISIAKMNNDRWAAIFGNGYNSTGDGTAKVFIVYLDSTGGHIELTTGVGDNNLVTTVDNNGMSTPEVLDLDNNGTADRIYAGDVLGNMWAFDVSDIDSANWASAYGTSTVPASLFVATDGSGNAQPITSKPSVDAHPTRSLRATSPNLLVTFGTGQYLTDTDQASGDPQTFYGVWDAGSGSLSRSDLVAQNPTPSVLSDGTIVRTNSSNTVNYNLSATTPELGWYIDLPVVNSVAERNVVDPAILGPIVFFNTLVPEGAQCAFGGSGFLMNVDLLTGGQPSFGVIAVPGNTGIYSAVESAGVPTGLTFVPNGGTNHDATRYVNTSRGIESGNISFGANHPGRTSWTSLTR